MCEKRARGAGFSGALAISKIANYRANGTKSKNPARGSQTGLRPARQGAQAEGLTEDSRGVERSEDPRKRGKSDYTLEGWQTTPAGRR